MTPSEKWNLLPQNSRDGLLHRFRDINVDFDWWSDTYSDFRAQMALIGVAVTEMYFTGFWSQGDGACFDGHISSWPLFLEAVAKPELTPASELLVERYHWEHSGRYYHENTVSFEDYNLIINNPYSEEDDPLRYAVWEASYPDPDGPIAAASDDFKEFLRDKMRELYSSLRQEYEHLTSDEVIREYILDFCEDELDELLETEQVGS